MDDIKSFIDLISNAKYAFFIIVILIFLAYAIGKIILKAALGVLIFGGIGYLLGGETGGIIGGILGIIGGVGSTLDELRDEVKNSRNR